jgi:hypothetical protein
MIREKWAIQDIIEEFLCFTKALIEFGMSHVN